MKVLVIDDDKLITSAIKSILKSDPAIGPVETGNSYQEALDLYKTFQPDLVLMDIRMGERSGLDALLEIKKLDPRAKVIMLTTFSDDDYIRRSVELGAYGYLLKSEFETIIPAIHSVYHDQKVYDPSVFSKIPKISSKPLSLEKLLTESEENIAKLIAKGKTNKEIAEELYLSEGTVRNYVSTILDKLDIKDRTKLAVYLITGEK